VSAFDDGEDSLRKLIDYWNERAASTRNEATTRLQVIDQLLFDVLGWDRGECEAEARLEGTYSDYEFSSPYRVLIAEAKREGISFEVPAGPADVLRPISFFRRHNKAVFQALEQCARYCQERGAPYGVVANGHQLIAFLAARTDGVAPLDGDCLVFESFEAMAAEFLLLWNSLSRSGVRQHGLLRQLLGAVAHPPDKLSSRIAGYPGFKNRNPLQTNLQILGDLVLEDMVRLPENEREFLETCYSPSGAISQYSKLNRRLLEARYSSLLAAESGASLSPALIRTGINPELLEQSLSRRPVLLVGDVGAGKTMFIRHFIRVDATEVLKNAIVLYLDLGRNPTFTAELPSFLWGEITRQLRVAYQIDIESRKFVRAVHQAAIDRFSHGIYSDLRTSDPGLYLNREIEMLEAALRDREEHIRLSLEHLTKTRRQQVVVFIDNVDQRPYELQQEAFLVANAMASNWPAAVFIALRPETFHLSRVRGSLSGYHLKAYTVAPPRLGKVIDKRFSYSLSLLKRGAVASLGSVGLEAPSLEIYLTVVRTSFAKNMDLAEFVDDLCGGNIRLALEFIKTFVASGHVNTQKILDIQAKAGRYLIPLHEFMRALLFGDHEYYNPDSAPIANVLDISTDDPREHFLMPTLLASVESTGRSEKDGFVSIDETYRAVQDAGYVPRQIDWAVARALSAKLLERPARTVADGYEAVGAEGAYLRVTTAGAYYTSNLLANFNYLDAVVTDTPIALPEFRPRIRDVPMIRDRLERATVFLEYLDAAWLRLARQDLPLDWPALAEQARADIRVIRSRLHS
jgi:hypothetical protein